MKSSSRLGIKDFSHQLENCSHQSPISSISLQLAARCFLKSIDFFYLRLVVVSCYLEELKQIVLAVNEA